jgi:hypothetical protein
MTHTAGILATATDALHFMEAGNATVTLVSKATAARYTFKVRKSDNGEIHFVSLMNGPDNEQAFAYIGYIRRSVFFHGGIKAKASADAPSVKAFAWTWKLLQQDIMSPALEIYHEGKCGRCGRKLTVPESVSRGIGPDCSNRMAA